MLTTAVDDSSCSAASFYKSLTRKRLGFSDEGNDNPKKHTLAIARIKRIADSGQQQVHLAHAQDNTQTGYYAVLVLAANPSNFPHVRSKTDRECFAILNSREHSRFTVEDALVDEDNHVYKADVSLKSDIAIARNRMNMLALLAEHDDKDFNIMASMPESIKKATREWDFAEEAVTSSIPDVHATCHTTTAKEMDDERDAIKHYLTKVLNERVHCQGKCLGLSVRRPIHVQRCNREPVYSFLDFIQVAPGASDHTP
eukprot:1323427-Prymnesium_polylepis.3